MARGKKVRQDIMELEQDYSYELCLLYDAFWEEGVKIDITVLDRIMWRLDQYHNRVLVHKDEIDGG